MPARAERFDAKASVLIENVTHHIEEEDQDWVPQARAGVGRKQLQELGPKLERARKKAPRSPAQPSALKDGRRHHPLTGIGSPSTTTEPRASFRRMHCPRGIKPVWHDAARPESVPGALERGPDPCRTRHGSPVAGGTHLVTHTNEVRIPLHAVISVCGRRPGLFW